LHIVRILLDEVFGRENFIVVITVKKKSSTAPGQSVADYIVWYAKDAEQIKMYKICADSGEPEDADKYRKILLATGELRQAFLIDEEQQVVLRNSFARDDYPVVSQHPSKTRSSAMMINGKSVYPPANCQWRYDPDVDMKRLLKAERLRAGDRSAFGIVLWGDSESGSISNIWTEFHGAANPIYVVQTNYKIIERCLLMTTDPGDLVLDPTCGSGTTAYVAEQWGRRWITIDTSRIAIAIARQRLMTARFENYKVKKPSGGTAENPGTGFNYKSVPHITLKSIAQNSNLDPIFAKHEPILESALKACNVALSKVDADTKRKFEEKLASKQRAEGKRALTDADERRWKLREKWEHWEVPFDTDPDWPEGLAKTVTEYRKAWRAKMDEVDACIAANGEPEELVDQPEPSPGVRVSGPSSTVWRPRIT
jgi:adenine-specific DNA-methyltransferase